MVSEHFSAPMADFVNLARSHVSAWGWINLQYGESLSTAHHACMEYVAHDGGIFRHCAFIGTIVDAERSGS